MLISIASGKGGTGKTTLSLLLAAAHPSVTLIDCDVEEPNCHLFLQPQWQASSGYKPAIPFPHIDAKLCNNCGACSSACLFNAIAVTGKTVLVFEDLCHSCGGCLLACRQQAISEISRSIGIIRDGMATAHPGIRLISGTLNIGISSAVPLIREMKQLAAQYFGDILLDCPPGTACTMVAAIQNSDFCLLVTEPTPFGRHDLELALNITRMLQIPTGVVINKSDPDIGDKNIEDLCRSRQIPVLAKIPHSLSFAKEYSAGKITDEFQTFASAIWRQITAGGGEVT